MAIKSLELNDVAHLTKNFSDLRKKALSILEGEDSFWALVEFIPDAVIVHSENKIIYNNPAADKLFGTTKEGALLGLNPLDLTHPDEHENVKSKRSKTSKGVRSGTVKSRRHIRLDGTEFYTTNSFIKYGSDDSPIFLIVMRDDTGPRETKRALELGEEQFRRSFEDANIGMMIIELDSIIRHVNTALCNMLGYDSDELIGQLVSILSHPDDSQIGPSEIEQMKQEGANTYHFEKRYLAKNNKTVWVSLNVSIVRDYAKLLSHVICHVENITDRKIKSNALLESEERFRRLYEDSTSGIWLLDLNGTVVSTNPALCDILGYQLEEIIGRPAVDFVHPEEREETMSAIASHDSSTVVEKRLIHKDGSTIWCSLTRSVVHDANGTPLYRFGQINDFTKQHKAEQKLKEREHLQELLARMTIAANESENSEKILNISLSEICKYTGWEIGHALLVETEKLEDIQSSKIWYLSDEKKYTPLKDLLINQVFDDSNNLLKKIILEQATLWQKVDPNVYKGPRTKQLIELEISLSIKIPIVVGRKTVGILEFFATNFIERNKNLIETIIQIGSQIGRAIERDWANETLLAAKQSVEMGSRAKSEFLANMSHELRSPLTAIIGFSQAMQSEIFGPLGSEKYLDYTDSILKSAEHLHAIINDVLDVSAIEAGALNMLEEPVDFSVVVSAALRMVSSRAETVGVTLINNIDSGIPKVFGDERRFKQVIVNLLANSIRFTPENGSIELSWNCPKSGGLNIYVKDTGIGMDEDGIAKALSVFGQVESDMARKFDGTGLGLPLSKSLIEAHDGTLSIESTLNEGTIINISIPPTRIIS